ncbi:MAG: zf-HC2 domain-containing protein [Candidatus Saccharicenans sp.]|jgi:predicted anti-sigma-YlaC factor YlaD|nr:zf-HC2 domain-containing protein [Candidatus Saccharicenans sp.]
MKCSDYQKLISDRMDGTLSPAGQKKLEAHLKTCQACHFYEEELKGIEAEIRKLPAVEPENLAVLEGELRERLIRAEAESRIHKHKSWGMKLAPAWAAGVFLVIAVLYLLVFNRPAERDQGLDLASLMSFEDSYLTLTQTLNSDESLNEIYNEEILNNIFEEAKYLNLEELVNTEDYQEQIINNNSDINLLIENNGLSEGL